MVKRFKGREQVIYKDIYHMMLNDLVLFPIRVRNLLNNTGISIVWQNQGVRNEMAFITLLRQRLQDMFIQDWHSRLDLSSRASLYRNLSNIVLL